MCRLLFARGLRLLRRRRKRGDGVERRGRRLKVGGSVLLGQGREGGRTRLLRMGRRPAKGRSKGIVRAGRSGLERFGLLLLLLSPRIMRSSTRARRSGVLGLSKGVIVWLLRLLRLAIRVCVVEGSLLRLEGVGLGKEIVWLLLVLLGLPKGRVEAGLLRLEAILLEASRLRLEAVRLAVGIVEETRVLGLLGLLVYGVAKPIDGALLLVALVEAGVLRLSRSWSIIE